MEEPAGTFFRCVPTRPRGERVGRKYRIQSLKKKRESAKAKKRREIKEI